MAYNLTYDYEYLNRIRDEIHKYPSPDKYEPPTQMRGGGVFKVGSNFLPVPLEQKQYRSGNSVSWTYYNRDILDKINKGEIKPPFLQGGNGAGRLKPSIMEDLEIEGGALISAKTKRKAKRLAKKAVKVAKPIIKQNLPKVLDIAVPAATTALASLAGPEAAPAGAILGLVAREGIKKLTGFSRGVGVYSPDMSPKERKLVDQILRKLQVKRGTDMGRALAVGKLFSKFLEKGNVSSLKGVVQAVGSVTDEPTKKALLNLVETMSGSGRLQEARSCSPASKKGGVSTRVPKKSSSSSKKDNPWVTFVKAYAKKHNMKYGDALKSAGKEYRKK